MKTTQVCRNCLGKGNVRDGFGHGVLPCSWCSGNGSITYDLVFDTVRDILMDQCTKEP